MNKFWKTVDEYKGPIALFVIFVIVAVVVGTIFNGEEAFIAQTLNQ